MKTKNVQKRNTILLLIAFGFLLLIGVGLFVSFLFVLNGYLLLGAVVATILNGILVFPAKGKQHKRRSAPKPIVCNTDQPECVWWMAANK